MADVIMEGMVLKIPTKTIIVTIKIAMGALTVPIFFVTTGAPRNIKRNNRPLEWSFTVYPVFLGNLR